MVGEYNFNARGPFQNYPCEIHLLGTHDDDIIDVDGVHRNVSKAINPLTSRSIYEGWRVYDGNPEAMPACHVHLSCRTIVCVIDTRSPIHHNRELQGRYPTSFEIKDLNIVPARAALLYGAQYPESGNCVKRNDRVFTGERVPPEGYTWNHKKLPCSKGKEFENPPFWHVKQPTGETSGLSESSIQFQDMPDFFEDIDSIKTIFDPENFKAMPPIIKDWPPNRTLPPCYTRIAVTNNAGETLNWTAKKMDKAQEKWDLHRQRQRDAVAMRTGPNEITEAGDEYYVLDGSAEARWTRTCHRLRIKPTKGQIERLAEAYKSKNVWKETSGSSSRMRVWDQDQFKEYDSTDKDNTLPEHQFEWNKDCEITGRYDPKANYYWSQPEPPRNFIKSHKDLLDPRKTKMTVADRFDQNQKRDEAQRAKQEKKESGGTTSKTGTPSKTASPKTEKKKAPSRKSGRRSGTTTNDSDDGSGDEEKPPEKPKSDHTKSKSDQREKKEIKPSDVKLNIASSFDSESDGPPTPEPAAKAPAGKRKGDPPGMKALPPAKRVKANGTDEVKLNVGSTTDEDSELVQARANLDDARTEIRDLKSRLQFAEVNQQLDRAQMSDVVHASLTFARDSAELQDSVLGPIRSNKSAVNAAATAALKGASSRQKKARFEFMEVVKEAAITCEIKDEWDHAILSMNDKQHPGEYKIYN
jgi:hypothetical protein